jgi:hypothetical protein
MDAAIQKELTALVENALCLKAENERLHEQVRELTRLIRACHSEDRSDMVLTMELLREAVGQQSFKAH